MKNAIFMAEPVAVWMIEQTDLTFEQIAHFCGLHILEVENLANQETRPIKACNPLSVGYLTREEIERCRQDPATHLRPTARPMVEAIQRDYQKKSRTYTPLAKRRGRPDGVAWLLKNYPKMPISTICRLLGTTSATVQAIRDKTHARISEIQPKDPVLLGLCSQTQLDQVIATVALQTPKENASSLEHRHEAENLDSDAADRITDQERQGL